MAPQVFNLKHMKLKLLFDDHTYYMEYWDTKESKLSSKRLDFKNEYEMDEFLKLFFLNSNLNSYYGGKREFTLTYSQFQDGFDRYNNANKTWKENRN